MRRDPVLYDTAISVSTKLSDLTKRSQVKSGIVRIAQCRIAQYYQTIVQFLSCKVRGGGGMADTPDLGSGASRLGGSSPPSRRYVATASTIGCFSVSVGRAALNISAALFVGCAPAALPAPPLPPSTAATSQELTLYREQEISYSRDHLYSSPRAHRSLVDEIRRHIPLSEAQSANERWVLLGGAYYSLFQSANGALPVLLRNSRPESTGAQVALDPSPYVRADEQAELLALREEPSGDRILIALDMIGRGRSMLLLADSAASTKTEIIAFDLPRCSTVDWLGKDQVVAIVTENLRPAGVLLVDLGSGKRQEIYRGTDTADAGATALSLARCPGAHCLLLHERGILNHRIFRLAAAANGATLKPFFTSTATASISTAFYGDRLFIAESGADENLTAYSRVLQLSLARSADEHPTVLWQSAGEPHVARIHAIEDGILGELRIDGRPALGLLTARNDSMRIWPLPEPYTKLELRRPVASADGTINALLSSPVIAPQDHQLSLSLLTLTSTEPRGRLHDLPPPASIAPQPSHPPARYEHRRMVEKGNDGSPLAVDIFYRPDRVSIGSPAPLLLHAYGAYGFALDGDFAPWIFPFLDRGGCYALAHVRGGGEFGPAWHIAGRGAGKVRSIIDLETIAQLLFRQKLTSPALLVGYGRSAGALLLAATALRAPGLFRGLILDAPFLDVLGTVRDETKPLSRYEWAEWGSPWEAEAVRAMERYSPYDAPNLTQLPRLLVRPAQRDEVIHLDESSRWLARIRRADLAWRDVTQHNHQPAEPARFFSPLDNWTHSSPNSEEAQLKAETELLQFLFETMGMRS